MGYDISVYDATGKKIEYIKTPNTTFIERNINWMMSIDARDRYRKFPFNPIELK
jgi:hypothetical protein